MSQPAQHSRSLAAAKGLGSIDDDVPIAGNDAEKFERGDVAET
jgi:hypothetical protein